MSEGMKVFDHLGELNWIIFELDLIGVKIDEEDKILRIIWSLPPSYAHMKPILMHGSPTISLGDVTSKLIPKKRRLKSEGKSIDKSTLLVNSGRKRNSKKLVTC